MKDSRILSVSRTAARHSRLLATVSVLLFAVAAGAIAQGTGAASPASGAVDPPSGFSPYAGGKAVIVSADAQSREVTLAIVGSEGNANDGFNFNNYANGDLLVEIPQGWKVTVQFTVQGSVAHSLVIVPWGNRSLSGPLEDAFPGSGVADPTDGYAQGNPVQTFSFTASSPGKYAMVCAVPGHVDVGMWDELDVVAGIGAPAVYVR